MLPNNQCRFNVCILCGKLISMFIVQFLNQLLGLASLKTSVYSQSQITRSQIT